MTKIVQAIRDAVFGIRPTFPVQARHIEYSAIMSADDEVSQPSERLFEVAAQSIELARDISMASVAKRMSSAPFYPEIWPGEHYKLLAGLVTAVKPKVVIEIGTFTGMSALAMLPSMQLDSELFTFDILPWNTIPETLLLEADFSDKRLRPLVADVSDRSVMQDYATLFQKADFIFIDGPKDHVFERKILERLAEINLPQKPIIMFDDIRVWNMLDIWRAIDKPKIDLTSFGHWSGTGLVDWQQ